MAKRLGANDAPGRSDGRGNLCQLLKLKLFLHSSTTLPGSGSTLDSLAPRSTAGQDGFSKSGAWKEEEEEKSGTGKACGLAAIFAALPLHATIC